MLTDLLEHNESPVPALPGRGGTYVDSVFGNTIIQVTDPTDGTYCHHLYSAIWGAFNKDSTRFIISIDDLVYAYVLNPVTYAISNKTQIFNTVPPSPGTSLVRYDCALWSGIDPNAIFVSENSSSRIWKYSFATSTYTLVKDVGAVLTPTKIISRMSKSQDDNVFAWTRQNSGFTTEGFNVFKVSTDAMLLTEATCLPTALGTDYYKVDVDKSGAWLNNRLQAGHASGFENYFHKLSDRTYVGLIGPGPASAPGFAPGHADMGQGIVYQYDDSSNAFSKRTFANPGTTLNSLLAAPDYTQESHLSLRNEDESWMTISFVESLRDHTNGLFHNEIFELSTDSLVSVRRYCHHHSTMFAGGYSDIDYWNFPRACVSPDRRFICFTSNMGSSTRSDVFIVVTGVMVDAPASPQRGWYGKVSVTGKVSLI